MRNKYILLAIPLLLPPYFTLFTLITIFFSSDVPLFKTMMESVFQNNAWYLICALFVIYLIAIISSIVCSIVSIHKKWDTLTLTKIIVAVKFLQIPAYLISFVVSAVFIITIFTIPFSIIFFLFNCISLISSGLIVTASVIISIRQGIFKLREVIWVILLQYVFCADVFAAFVYYVMLKKRNKVK